MRLLRNIRDFGIDLVGAAAIGYLTLFPAKAQEASVPESRYAVVASQQTYQNEEWDDVVNSLRDKYGAKIHIFKEDIAEARESLAEQKPTHVAYVERPEVLAIPELPVGTGFEGLEKERITAANSGAGRFYRLLDFDADPYRDAIGGIITGMTAEDALGLVNAEGFLVDNVLMKTLTHHIRDMFSGTGFSDSLQEGGTLIRFAKTPGKLEESRVKVAGPEFLEKINGGEVDMVVTSGHATCEDWNPGYGYPDDRYIINREGGIVVITPQGKLRGKVDSQNPKVYWGPGNCQIARIKSPSESLALSWIHSGGVKQYFGYIQNTWHGFAGWGMANYLFASDTPTFFEAMQKNSIALQYYKKKLAAFREKNSLEFGEEEYGKIYDEYGFVGYGDPLLDVRIQRDPEYTPYLTNLVRVSQTAEGTRYRFNARLNREPGSHSPPVFLIPEGIGNPRDIQASEGLEFEIGDDFVLFDVFSEVFAERGAPKLRFRDLQPGQEWSLEFTAN